MGSRAIMLVTCRVRRMVMKGAPGRLNGFVRSRTCRAEQHRARREPLQGEREHQQACQQETQTDHESGILGGGCVCV